MTDQEIKKLQEKLGPEYSVKRLNGAVTVELVGIWDGVEFAECINWVDKSLENGRIFPLSVLNEDTLLHSIMEGKIKPSTEASYVEQLKSKAHELYGEIKDGDRFDRIEMEFEDNHRIGEVRLSVHGWDYYKIDDKLYFGTICIYQQGKWAKKVYDPIKVNVSSIRYLREPIEYMGELIPSDNIDCTVHFTIEGSSPKIILKDEFRQLLSKCLEEYLNKIP